MYKIIDKKTGKDILPEVLEKVSIDDNIEPSVWKKLIQTYGWLSYKSDDHIGEYLSFGANYSGTKWKYGIESKELTNEYLTERRELLARTDLGGTKKKIDLRAELDSGDMSESFASIKPSGEIAMSVIAENICDITQRHDAVNLMNKGGLIPNLPETAIIEVPCVSNGKKGIEPIAVDPLPEGPAAFIRKQLSIIRLITEAYRTRSMNLLLQALLLDPIVNNIENAEKMLDEMLHLQREFLPEFA